MLAALALIVTIFLLYEAWRGLTRGRIGWGEGVRVRSEQPLEFWGQVAFAFFSALAIMASLVWHWRYGELPSIPFLQIVLAVWLSTLIIRALVRGRASVGSVSFSRTEEPREYWILFAAALLFLAFFWGPLLVRVFGR
jgi:hypothetical protein